MAYDPNLRRIILFGGVNAFGTALNDTWFWTGTDWQLLSTANSPGARYGHAMTTQGSSVYVSGGFRSLGYTDNDAWRFNGSNWSLYTASSANPPSPRLDHGLAPQVGSGLLLHGGQTPAGLSGETFTGSSQQGSSTPVRGHTLVYDPMSNRVLRFGGETDAGVSATLEAWNGFAWSTLGTGPIGPRTQHSMVYDPTRGVCIVFGGRGATYFGDTWELSGSTWTPPMLMTSPSPRASHAMAFDVDGGFAVLFGGEAPDGGVLGDTWVYAP